MSDFNHLRNKKSIITGGNKGIGRDIALAFAKLGTHVIISGRDEAALIQTTKQMQQYQPQCSYVASDISSVDSIFYMVDEAVSRMGGIDVLVNNAGINIAKPALEVTEVDWDRVLDTNLKGSFFCSQRAGKYMTEQRSGRIINIASQMAFVGYRDRAAYCSSKGGVVQMTKALAVEWAKYQVKVNAVAPTFIETELTTGMFKDESFKTDVLSRIPLGSLAQSSDVTGAVIFLASDMANFITGETIKVDGGWTAI